MYKAKGVINKIVNSIPVEMHLLNHQSIGPETQLQWGKTRLNPDLKHKNWRKPISRIDEAAYKHYPCYLRTKKLKLGEEVCDKDIL